MRLLRWFLRFGDVVLARGLGLPPFHRVWKVCKWDTK